MVCLLAPVLLAGSAYLVDHANATELVQLTFTGRDENWSTWAPGGNTLLLSSGEYICGGDRWFCGDQNIWELSLAGEEPIGLQMRLADAYHPRMSPDGQWVAGMVHNGNDFDIFLWPSDDLSNGQLFQSLPGANERFPNWSNDSQFIAFDTDKIPHDIDGTTGVQIYFAPVGAPADPSAAVQLTSLGFNNKHPTWNHDSTEIAYVGDAQSRRSISAVTVPDGEYRQITPHSSQNRHPDWSPDGKFIAFVTDRWDGIGDVAIVRADGNGLPIRITEGMPGHDDFPEWSHDSQRLAFCGTAIVPPVQPNKEIYLAVDLPLDEVSVPTEKTTFGSFRARFGLK